MMNWKVKFKAYVCIIILVLQAAYPTTAFALADSPDQVEFQSFEKSGSTDMVNLITGDFSYNIPTVKVPSPEGGYSLPLTYHAGIQLEEDASWVGLGWNINPGVLTRQASVYPDDFNGQTHETTIQNQGTQGYVESFPFIKKYYESGKSTGGTIDILGIVDAGWGSESQFGIAPTGLKVKDGEISYSAEYMAEGITNAAELAFSVAAPGVSTAYSMAKTAMALSSNVNNSAKLSFSGWHEEASREKIGFLSNRIHRKSYYYQSYSNRMYGSLYLGNLSDFWADINFKTRNGNGNTNGIDAANNNATRLFSALSASCEYPASDMFMSYENEYAVSDNPTSISYDNYNVKVSGVEGSIVILPIVWTKGSFI